MSKLLEKYLSEFGGQTFLKPDTSGIRGQGVNRKSYELGDDEYPYGKSEPTYGQPAASSRDSAGHGGSHAGAPVPKGVSDDDDRWEQEIEEIGREGWVSNSALQGNIVDNPGSKSKFGMDDEEVEEAMGVPFNVAKAGQGTGRGTRFGGGWSSSPRGGEWDDHMPDDELEKAGRQDEFNYGLPFSSNTYKVNPGSNYDEDDISLITFHIPTDSETEEDDDPVVTRMNMLNNPNFNSIGRGSKQQRMSPGMTWRESYLRDREIVQENKTMELTIKDLEEVIKKALKALEDEGEKGRDGYGEEGTNPRGYSSPCAMDFSKPSEEGNRYAQQGAVNWGPYTNESALRAVVRNMIKENFSMKPIPKKMGKASAPFNGARVSVGEEVSMPEWNSTKKGGSVWETVAKWYDNPSAKKKSKKQKKVETNIMQGVYEERVKETKNKTKNNPLRENFLRKRKKCEI